MTNEEKKELLIKDLCARLPYGVQCKYNRILPIGWEVSDLSTDGTLQSIEIETSGSINVKIDGRLHGLSDFKPYLRPMSSMTEEEQEEYMDLIIPVDGGKAVIEEEKFIKVEDFYNQHLLDYRGLIPKGLALPAKEGMYTIK